MNKNNLNLTEIKAIFIKIGENFKGPLHRQTQMSEVLWKSKLNYFLNNNAAEIFVFCDEKKAIAAYENA